MQQGWIKIHRKILDSTVFDNPKMLKTWIWCLCKASHTEHDVTVGKQMVHLNPGQFIFGRLKAADVLQMNDRTVYDYIKLLEKLNMISINSNNKFSVITIENWALYQGDECVNQHQTTNKTTNQSTIKNHTYKKGNNGENEKKIFIPPSVEEVRAYCFERGNGIDAESFVSFYESKGWMVGKNKMKDWKAAIRTWERNTKQGGSRGNAINTEQRAEYEKFSL